MRIFKTKRFAQFAKENQLSHKALIQSIQNVEKGLINANLGGGLIKQRIPKQGRGKSAGYRTIITYRVKDMAIFLVGYSKNQQENITPENKEDLKIIAKQYFLYSPTEFEQLIKQGSLILIYPNNEEYYG